MEIARELRIKELNEKLKNNGNKFLWKSINVVQKKKEKKWKKDSNSSYDTEINKFFFQILFLWLDFFYLGEYNLEKLFFPST